VRDVHTRRPVRTLAHRRCLSNGRRFAIGMPSAPGRSAHKPASVSDALGSPSAPFCLPRAVPPDADGALPSSKAVAGTDRAPPSAMGSRGEDGFS
jgi:hypothetical protein